MMTAEMSDEELIDAIKENEADVYIGMGSDEEWQRAAQQNKQTLWNLHHF